MNDERLVTVGVDTHTDVYVAAVLDQGGAQIDAIITSAPEQVRGQLRKLNPRQRIRACAASSATSPARSFPAC